MPYTYEQFLQNTKELTEDQKKAITDFYSIGSAVRGNSIHIEADAILDKSISDNDHDKLIEDFQNFTAAMI